MEEGTVLVQEKQGDGSALRALVDLRDKTLQKSRIAFSNRLSAVERGADVMDADQVAILTKWGDLFDRLETEADHDIAAFVADMPIVERMVNVRGVGKLLAAKVVSMIDIRRADTVSALWRYAGYGVVEGERERPTKGEKLHYNSRLKTTCYLVGTSMLRANSPYRRVYDAAREYYAVAVHVKDCPPCHAKAGDPLKDGHKHARATRKMVKVWLAHLWQVWRELEGLPTRELYAMEHQDHTHYAEPKEFGW